MEKEIVILALILCLFVISGISCKGKAEILIGSCKEACYKALNETQDLSAGPCLLDPMPEDSNWVCDIAHDPRQPVDNERENQCDAWHNGTAKHFIELTPECEFITAH